MSVLRVLFALIRNILADRAELVTENLALRQQLAILEHKSKRPRLRKRDRIFWAWLSRLWPNWQSALLIVQPETVVRWHQQGFRIYWRWKSRSRKSGRPKIYAEIRKLIRRMSRENPSWGTPRIRYRKPPSQTWRTFLDNHIRDIVAVDFFTVPTATFRILFCFVVLRHHRRTVVHFNVTANPTAGWAAQQVVEAFPEETTPRFLIRDRDSIYGEFFRQWIKHMGIEQVVTAYRSPWQSPYVERIIGSIRRDCLNHVIVLNERHLRRILTDYFYYYHHARAHLSLDRNSPVPREVELPERGKVSSIPMVGGLHHRYRRAA